MGNIGGVDDRGGTGGTGGIGERGDRASDLILRLLKEVIPRELAGRPIRPETSLLRELGIDSLRKMALAFRLEEASGADLTAFTGDVAEIQTVGDLIAAAQRLLGSSSLSS